MTPTLLPVVVVGVDGSEPSRHALRWAAHQAELTGAEVIAVIAWHLPDMYSYVSHGYGAFEGMLLGSVSQHCVHHATCPEVVVPPPAGSPRALREEDSP